MKKLTKYGVAAVLLAVTGQALWESPLVKFAWHATYLGGRAAWAMQLRPGWVFDLIAITINATIYFFAMVMLQATAHWFRDAKSKG